MTWNEYTSLFEKVLNLEHTDAPYDNPEYVNYVKMNKSRSNRWMKGDILNNELVQKLKAIDSPQEWIMITEPWCGDAAHNVPVIAQLSEQNPLINFNIELRDNGNNVIDKYLTNGGKAIPILVVRDKDGNDLFVWGPRPGECQQVMTDATQKGLPILEKHKLIQTWYGKDKGATLQKELLKFI